MQNRRIQNEEALLIGVLPSVVRGELERAEKLRVGLVEKTLRFGVHEDPVSVAPDDGVRLGVASVDELGMNAVESACDRSH